MPSAYLESLMGASVRVSLTDTRQVYGSLHCVDYLCNLILHEVRIQLPEVTSETSVRFMNSAMVNSRDIVKIEKLVE
jgi:small nuclear ribonucleoprotein (snRNP)-like protein